MLDAFNISATGLQSQQTQVETIANNLSNVNTDGYKKSKVIFQDLVSKQLGVNGNGLINNNLVNSVGMGSSVGLINKIFTSGDPKATDRPLDIFIQGSGFLEVVMPNGEYGYTRAGNLSVDENGVLTNADGFSLSSLVQIPPDAQDVVIDSDGVVSVSVSGQEGLVNIGQLELSTFINESGLSALGGGIYMPSQKSGNPSYGRPGETGFGSLQQGFVEASNVNLVEELTSLMSAQRGYELNARVVQAADDMLSIINTLRR
jgi:flagellar basal-body rod protein FlgG